MRSNLNNSSSDDVRTNIKKKKLGEAQGETESDTKSSDQEMFTLRSEDSIQRFRGRKEAQKARTRTTVKK